MGLNERNKIRSKTDYNIVECQPGFVGSNYLISSEPSDDTGSNIVPSIVPSIVPCYNGKSLKIHEELVVNGLSAISIRHHRGNCKDEKRVSEDCALKKKSSKESRENKENENQGKKMMDLNLKNLSAVNDGPDCLKDKMKRRNSFWSVHKPELSKLTWPENFVSSAVLQDFFHYHLRIHGTFCEPLHEFTNRPSIMDEEYRDYSKLKEIVPPRILPPDEKVVNIMEKSRSVQLNDEDLDPVTMVHKSRAEFCVTIGEYVRRPPLKRTTSQQMPKYVAQPASRFESLPLQYEGLMSKETMVSDEKVSAVIGSTDFHLNPSDRKKSSKKLSSGNISGLVRMASSLADSQNAYETEETAPQTEEQVTEDSGDPARLRTILSPRDEAANKSESRHYRV